MSSLERLDVGTEPAEAPPDGLARAPSRRGSPASARARSPPGLRRLGAERAAGPEGRRPGRLARGARAVHARPGAGGGEEGAAPGHAGGDSRRARRGGVVRRPAAGRRRLPRSRTGLPGGFEPLLVSRWMPVPPEGPCRETGDWPVGDVRRAWLERESERLRGRADTAPFLRFPVPGFSPGPPAVSARPRPAGYLSILLHAHLPYVATRNTRTAWRSAGWSRPSSSATSRCCACSRDARTAAPRPLHPLALPDAARDDGRPAASLAGRRSDGRACSAWPSATGRAIAARRPTPRSRSTTRTASAPASIATSARAAISSPPFARSRTRAWSASSPAARPTASCRRSWISALPPGERRSAWRPRVRAPRGPSTRGASGSPSAGTRRGRGGARGVRRPLVRGGRARHPRRLSATGAGHLRSAPHARRRARVRTGRRVVAAGMEQHRGVSGRRLVPRVLPRPGIRSPDGRRARIPPVRRDADAPRAQVPPHHRPALFAPQALRSRACLGACGRARGPLRGRARRAGTRGVGGARPAGGPPRSYDAELFGHWWYEGPNGSTACWTAWRRTAGSPRRIPPRPGRASAGARRTAASVVVGRGRLRGRLARPGERLDLSPPAPRRRAGCSVWHARATGRPAPGASPPAGRARAPARPGRATGRSS